MNDNIQGIINPEGKKNLTPTDMLEGRKRLVNHFGGKIAGEPKSSWTTEEKVAGIFYQTLTENLYKLAPDVKIPDSVHRVFEKNEVNSIFGLLFKYAIKTFWIILAIAALLALIKFVLH